MNNTEFDLRLLSVFQALLSNRSVSRAAESLDMSQPSVSRALSRLRNHFNDELFVRTRAGMSPTPHALELQPTVDQMLSLYHSQLTQWYKFDPKTSKRTFNIAASEIGHALFLPRLINQFEAGAPGVTLKGVPLGTHSLTQELESGQIDVALGSFPRLLGGIYERTLFTEQYICIVRSNHPVIKRTLSAERFSQAKHIIVSAKGLGHVHGQVEKLIVEQCPKENIRVVSHDFLACTLIALQTDYVVTVPSKVLNIFRQESGLRAFQPPVKLPSFDVKQYWHERYHKEPSNKWIRDRVASCFRRTG